MKKLFALFVLLTLSAWTLACENRALTQPVSPTFQTNVSSTPTWPPVNPVPTATP